jgi:hypothetical protein
MFSNSTYINAYTRLSVNKNTLNIIFLHYIEMNLLKVIKQALISVQAFYLFLQTLCPINI